ncbi:50S ribosomal protein L25 [Paenibacillus sp. Z6-24]
MSNLIELNARTHEQKSQNKNLRKEGNIPAVVYGKDFGSRSVSVGEKALLLAIKENGHAILNASIPEIGNKPVVIQNIQRDALTNKIIHIDFHQLNMNASMDSMVTIHFVGEPAGVKAGGSLQTELYEIETRCMPDNLLSSFEVDISSMNIGDSLLVSDLELHKGVEVLTEPTAVIIRVAPQGQTAEETTEETTA